MDDPHLPQHELTGSIIAAFFEVYNKLDYGLLEALYSAALTHELRARGHHVSREVIVQVLYKGSPIGIQRLDMVVDSIVIVEVQSTAVLHPHFRRPLISYLSATRISTGLLLHFGPNPKAFRLFGRDQFGLGGTRQ